MVDPLIKAVKEKRKASQLSLRALSDAVGVSFSALARLERGEGRPDDNTKVRLAEWLGSDAHSISSKIDRVAFVHFRAAKNADSEVVQALLEAADCVRQFNNGGSSPPVKAEEHVVDAADRYVSLGKDVLEETALALRKSLNLSDDKPFDPQSIKVNGVTVDPITQSNCLAKSTKKSLTTKYCSQWSAMSVPLDINHETWAILLNDCHTVQRQKVTLLEEYWHIILGHRLTRITKIGNAFGRSYDTAEEHDAYYLAAATLLPKPAMIKYVHDSKNSEFIAKRFGVSSQLVDYRLKRLGLWHVYMFSRVSMG